ncbi:EamA family transporter [Sphingomonas melonis]|jgi:inner membrane transporter RhtA|uniref:Inner membrane transporter RhtA n=1 Tax=Sphingomonas melonis TaxID=152682 RepID=A0A7Y9K4U4_9SPHN|nr:EamA family transporter [Sphingomonas melonis]NYD91745.1 inner membrane transporter RhtA [Sphingomonas melonis]
MNVPGRGAAALFSIAPLLLSIISLYVGTSFAKTFFPIAGAAGITAMRIGLGALLMLAVQRPWRWAINREQRLAIAGYGVVLACMNLSFYAAVARLPLGVAIAIEFIGPLGVAFLRSRRMLDVLWVTLAAAGIGVLAVPRSAGTVTLDGVAYALLAALFWALYIISGACAARLVPQHGIVCLGLCTASIVAVPAGIAEAGSALLDPIILASGVAVAVLCSILPYSLETFALKRMTPATFEIIVSLEPAVGAFAAFAVISERLTDLQMIGIATVIVAAAGGTMTSAKRQAAVLPVA